MHTPWSSRGQQWTSPQFILFSTQGAQVPNVVPKTYYSIQCPPVSRILKPARDWKVELILTTPKLPKRTWCTWTWSACWHPDYGAFCPYQILHLKSWPSYQRILTKNSKQACSKEKCQTSLCYLWVPGFTQTNTWRLAQFLQVVFDLQALI